MMKHVEKWRLIDSGSGPASENMSIDEAILKGCQHGDSPPSLHFYLWEKPAITLGYLQNFEQTVRIEECIAGDVEVVRRITGGKAVVHQRDLGFSLIFPAKGKTIPSGTGSSYCKIAQGVIKGLEELGIDAQLADGKLYQRLSPQARRDIYACFLTRISHEVLACGRKLVGFAQRRIGQWVLTQGTLMVDLERILWVDLLNYPEGLTSGEVKNSLFSGMISITEILDKKIDNACIKDALINGFSDVLGIRFETQCLFPGEMKEKDNIAREKYGDLLRKYKVNV